MRRLLPAFVVLLALNLVTLAAWTLPQGYKQRNAAAQLQAAREELAAARRSVAQLRDRATAIRSNLADVGRFYAKQTGSEAVRAGPDAGGDRDDGPRAGAQARGARLLSRRGAGDAPSSG